MSVYVSFSQPEAQLYLINQSVNFYFKNAKSQQGFLFVISKYKHREMK